MEVKIYREKENEQLMINEADREEYNTLAEKLGLSNFKNEQERIDRIPVIYPYLNAMQKRALQVLCPKIEPVDKFKKSTIPLEILRVYDICQREEMFEGYEVWYNDADPDPLFVGWRYEDENARKGDYTWQRNKYLIGRWGDCAYEIPELMQMAFERLREQMADSIDENIAKLKMMREALDASTRKVLNEGTTILTDIRIRTNVN